MTHYTPETTTREVAHHLKEEIKGKNVLITGCSSEGLGAAAATAIAAHNPNLLVLAGRSRSKVEQTEAALKAQFPTVNIRVLEIDLASFVSIRKAADEVNGYKEALDVLINNAAIMATSFAKTVDGIESNMGTNHIGPFLFTNLLLGRMLQSGKTARVVNVSSSAYRLGAIRYEDVNYETEEYETWKAYAASKSANILFSEGLVHRFGSKGLQSFSLHPGVISTQLFRDMHPEEYDRSVVSNPRLRFKTMAQGAACHLVAAFDPTILEFNGGYLEDCQIAKLMEEATWLQGKTEADRLWAFSEDLVGQNFPSAAHNI